MRVIVRFGQGKAPWTSEPRGACGSKPEASARDSAHLPWLSYRQKKLPNSGCRGLACANMIRVQLYKQRRSCVRGQGRCDLFQFGCSSVKSSLVEIEEYSGSLYQALALDYGTLIHPGGPGHLIQALKDYRARTYRRRVNQNRTDSVVNQGLTATGSGATSGLAGACGETN